MALANSVALFASLWRSDGRVISPMPLPISFFAASSDSLWVVASSRWVCSQLTDISCATFSAGVMRAEEIGDAIGDRRLRVTVARVRSAAAPAPRPRRCAATSSPSRHLATTTATVEPSTSLRGAIRFMAGDHNTNRVR